VNYVNIPIRDFTRILNADGSEATGIAASITINRYNPLLFLVDTANPTEQVNGIYYYDFTPIAIGAWLIRWDCPDLEIHTMKVYDVIEDIVAQLKGFATQAW